jgi:hypothetical protein
MAFLHGAPAGYDSPIAGPYLDSLATLDWKDLSSVRTVCGPILRGFGLELARIAAAMQYTLNTPELLGRCVSDGFFDRVVLYEAPDKHYSIRVHFLVPTEYERPHNHRATFVTRLISGQYIHSIYTLPHDVWSRDSRVPLTKKEISQLRPTLVRLEQSGSGYVLHHSVFHSTIGDSHHASIVIRGPSERERLLFVDQRLETAVWMFGGNFGENASQEAESKRSLGGGQMSDDRLRHLIDRVRSIEPIDRDF